METANEALYDSHYMPSTELEQLWKKLSLFKWEFQVRNEKILKLYRWGNLSGDVPLPPEAHLTLYMTFAGRVLGSNQRWCVIYPVPLPTLE